MDRRAVADPPLRQVLRGALPATAVACRDWATRVAAVIARRPRPRCCGKVAGGGIAPLQCTSARANNERTNRLSNMHRRLVEGGATHGVPSLRALQLAYTSQPCNATKSAHARPSSIQDAAPSAVFLVHRGIPHRSPWSKTAATGIGAKASTHPLPSLRTACTPSNCCGQHALPPIAVDSTRLSSTPYTPVCVTVWSPTGGHAAPRRRYGAQRCAIRSRSMSSIFLRVDATERATQP